MAKRKEKARREYVIKHDKPKKPKFRVLPIWSAWNNDVVRLDYIKECDTYEEAEKELIKKLSDRQNRYRYAIIQVHNIAESRKEIVNKDKIQQEEFAVFYKGQRVISREKVEGFTGFTRKKTVPVYVYLGVVKAYDSQEAKKIGYVNVFKLEKGKLRGASLKKIKETGIDARTNWKEQFDDYSWDGMCMDEVMKGVEVRPFNELVKEE